MVMDEIPCKDFWGICSKFYCFQIYLDVLMSHLSKLFDNVLYNNKAWVRILEV